MKKTFLAAAIAVASASVGTANAQFDGRMTQPEASAKFLGCNSGCRGGDNCSSGGGGGGSCGGGGYKRTSTNLKAFAITGQARKIKG